MKIIANIIILLLLSNVSFAGSEDLTSLFSHNAYENTEIQILVEAEQLIESQNISSHAELANANAALSAAIFDGENGNEEIGAAPSYSPAHKAGAFCAGFCCGVLGIGAMFYLTDKDPTMTEFSLIGGLGCMIVWGVVYAAALNNTYYY